MNNNKGYNQVIEWEYVDELTLNNSELSIAVLLYIINILKQRQEFNNLYKFSVISYGWLGYYPAIGVQYIDKDSKHLDEDYIDDEFDKIVRDTSLIEFVNFSQNYYEEIKNIKDEIFRDNNS